MSGMDGARRELKRLRDKLGERDFRGGAPPLDQDFLPVWDGATPLSVDGYARALGDLPVAELSVEELETRERLSPYSALFEQLQRDATEKAENEEVEP